MPIVNNIKNAETVNILKDTYKLLITLFFVIQLASCLITKLRKSLKALSFCSGIALCSLVVDAGTLTPEEREYTISSIAELMEEKYVYPQLGKAMADYINEQKKNGRYAAITNNQRLAERLTEDLLSITNDQHIAVLFDPFRVTNLLRRQQNSSQVALNENTLLNLKRDNYGFKAVQILSGNIGYLNLTSFVHTKYTSAAEKAVAAMNYLADTDALIIDLRRNGGGEHSMIQLISSYLFHTDPVHLNNFYWRNGERTEQIWTLPFVPGKRMPEIPVYILTSKDTFSAAEEFAYNLKNLKRATLIGEVSGGGAHPVDFKVINGEFILVVPIGRAINPISHTNWEGVGVKPNIVVTANKALLRARVTALDELARKGVSAKYHQWHLRKAKAELVKISIPSKILKEYVGNYGVRNLTYDDGSLYYHRNGNSKQKLLPLARDLFQLSNVDNFRIKIIKRDNKVIAIKALYADGRSEENVKVLNKDKII
jgi:hypothetical protein